MPRFKKMLTGMLIVVMVLAMGGVGAFASSSDTISRGYQMIDGNVCDLSGNLLIKMHNGLTLGGYTLSPDFKVYYPRKKDSQSVPTQGVKPPVETAAPVDTVSRGYQMIDGNVCDLSGNLLIKMHDGMTPDGNTLSPDFRVYYPQKLSSQANSAESANVFSGTTALRLKADGIPGKKLGVDFKVSADRPDLIFSYRSGDPAGIDFTVVDMNHNAAIVYVSDVLPMEGSEAIPLYDGDHPDETYQVLASAAGSAGASGNAYMTIVMQ